MIISVVSRTILNWLFHAESPVTEKLVVYDYTNALIMEQREGKEMYYYYTIIRYDHNSKKGGISYEI